MPRSFTTASGSSCLRTADPTPLRTDQQITLVGAALGEFHSYPAVFADSVATHGMSEPHHVVEPREQCAPKGFPVHIRDLVRAHVRESLHHHRP
ncbi:hypothetical protein LTV02_00645 [Nocardia yamanashiensis]|uniref:hypothetical protein n=1 Tax=Nocardia yamanashiensis TaxID=209247 RepID=UPI001E39DD5A|nr:hypothetical protein [Nocardia yamanashiensis]UGT41974.1 hypothetical protein LTV02_00645 [Nocardia yamanashiensis]